MFHARALLPLQTAREGRELASDFKFSHLQHHSFDTSLHLKSKFLLPLGRRLKVPLAKKNVYTKSFIPAAVSVLNVEF